MSKNYLKFKIHVVFQSHAPGAKRIKLDTPEEIAKWREERRRYNSLLFTHQSMHNWLACNCQLFNCYYTYCNVFSSLRIINAVCRNYPTQSNVEKRIKLMEVREKRGDVLETSQFGYVIVLFSFLYAASVQL